MPTRTTLIGQLSEESIAKLQTFLEGIDVPMCKVPYGKKVTNRFFADTLPWHFTLSAQDIACEKETLAKLEKIAFPKMQIDITEIATMPGKEESTVLYFKVRPSKELISLHREVYQSIPSPGYEPLSFNFHLTIHIDKDKGKIEELRKFIENKFSPCTLDVENFALYEIYPAHLVKIFSSN